MAETGPYRLADAWQRGDFTLENAAAVFWRRHRLLPPRVDLRARARQLCVIAFAATAAGEEEVVGVTTLVVRLIPQLRAKLAMLRCSVAPNHRRLGAATALTVATRDVVESWARRNPEHELKGLGAVVQGEDLALKQQQAIWPQTRLNLAGYNQRGEQLRVAWFKDAKVL